MVVMVHFHFNQISCRRCNARVDPQAWDYACTILGVVHKSAHQEEGVF